MPRPQERRCTTRRSGKKVREQFGKSKELKKALSEKGVKEAAKKHAAFLAFFLLAYAFIFFIPFTSLANEDLKNPQHGVARYAKPARKYNVVFAFHEKRSQAKWIER